MHRFFTTLQCNTINHCTGRFLQVSAVPYSEVHCTKLFLQRCIPRVTMTGASTFNSHSQMMCTICKRPVHSLAGYNQQCKDFSKHRPSGPRLSISQNVHMSVCLCVCSLFRYRLTFFLPQLPKVGCNILRDSESLGKSNGKKWSQI